MTDTIEITPFDPKEWKHVQRPMPDMPEFSRDAVVDGAGAELELGDPISDHKSNLLFPCFLTIRGGPSRVRFRIVVHQFDTATGTGIDRNAAWYLDDLRVEESDNMLLRRVARAVRALILAISSDAWEIERLKIMEKMDDI